MASPTRCTHLLCGDHAGLGTDRSPNPVVGILLLPFTDEEAKARGLGGVAQGCNSLASSWGQRAERAGVCDASGLWPVLRTQGGTTARRPVSKPKGWDGWGGGAKRRANRGCGPGLG